MTDFSNIKKIRAHGFIALFFSTFMLISCNQRKKEDSIQGLKNYDEKGKLIVYSENVYCDLWAKKQKFGCYGY